MRAILCLAICALPLAASGQETPAAAPVSFSRDIAPILIQRCVACHGAERPKGGFALHTFDALLKGVNGEKAIVAGDAGASLLVDVLQPDHTPRMPFKEDALPSAQIELIARWVKEGAKFDGPAPSASLVSIVPKPKNQNVPPAIYPAPLPVTAIAFSPDGTRFATGGYHEILIWDTATAKLLRRMQGLPERTYAIRFSPNGWWIATASGTPAQSGLVRLWDVQTGEPIRDLIEVDDAVFALAFSADSKLLASGGVDRTIRIWDMATGKLAHAIEDHADWVLDVDFSPDSKRLVSASRDKTSKLFDVTKGESVVTFPEHTEPVYAVAFARDGKSIASAGGDKVIKMWNAAEEAKKIRDIGGHGMAIFKLAFTPDGSQLVTCSADKTVREFSPANGQQTRAMQGHNDWIYCAAISADGKWIASGSWDGEVRIWNASDGALVRNLVAMPNAENSKDVPAVGLPVDAAPVTAPPATVTTPATPAR